VIGVGIVGCGRISDLHAAPYLRDPRARIVAVADVEPALVQERGERWGVPATARYLDHQQLLADDDVEVVEILSPHHLHHPMTLDALAAGKHVAVQKPMALDLPQADEMVAAAASAAGRCKVFENFIMYPPIRRARELIDAGEIGEPIAIRLKSNAGISPTAWEVPRAAAMWRFDPSRCGGGPLTFDDGHHKFAIAWYLMGPPADVHAWIVERELAPGYVLDSPAIISWRFTDQRVGSFEVVHSPNLVIRTEQYAQDDRVEITGTDGVIWVTRGHGQLRDEPAVILRRGDTERTFDDMPTAWSSSFDASVLQFLDVLERGGDPLLTAAQGRDILSYALAAQESSRTGQVVHLGT
jgi:predicted dehydrogenase